MIALIKASASFTISNRIPIIVMSVLLLLAAMLTGKAMPFDNSTKRYFVAGDPALGVSVGYNWSDSVEMRLLWVDCGSDRDSIFYNFRNNDILQIHLRYIFQI